MKQVLLMFVGTTLAWTQLFTVGVRGGIPLTDFVNTVTSSDPTLDSFGATTKPIYRRPNRRVISSIWVRRGDGGVPFDTLNRLNQTLLSATPSSHPPELRHNAIWGETIGGGLDIRLAVLHFLPEIRYTRWNTQHFAAPDDLLHWNQNQAEFLLGITFGGAPH